MSVDGTLGSMLQGVSQQPAHIRVDGEVGEQINVQPDIVRGLTSRPGGRRAPRSDIEGGNTPNNEVFQALRYATLISDGDGLQWQDFQLNGITYQIGTKEGRLFVLDNTGRPINVIQNTAGVFDYLSTNMTVFVFEDKVYLVNRDKIVQDTSSDPTADAASITAAEKDVRRGEGFITILEGFFGHNYQVEVTFEDGTFIEAEYRTPNGDGANDAEQSSSDYIAARLLDGLRDHPDQDGVASITRSGSVLRIRDLGESNPVVEITTRSGRGDSSIRTVFGTVDRIENLPLFASNGSIVKVIGEDDTTDDFYMRFRTTDDTVAIGGGFRQAGVWEEWFEPSETHELLASTMPHVLTQNELGEFVLSEEEWLPRRVGDSETNPMPTFVGRAIKDMTGFQSRLCFITETHFTASRTGEPTDFFLQSALAVIDSDPVDVLSTARSTVSMQWFVPFDRDLVIFGKKHQFLITGNTPLTPSNASIVQTTDFEANVNAAPVSTGRTVLFPFDSGGYTGIREFFSANSVDANEAVTISETVDEYMAGSCTRLVGSTNFGTLFIQTDESNDFPNTVYVYKYFWDGETKAQSAWYKWTFEDDIANIFFEDSLVGVLLRDATTGEYTQLWLDLDLPDHPDTGYPVTLDFQLDLEASQISDSYVVSGYVDDDYVEDFSTGDPQTTFVDFNKPNAELVQGAGCAVPGQRIRSFTVTQISSGVWRYEMDIQTAPIGATVIVGVPYDQLVEPTMPFLRDRNGRAKRSRALTLTEFAIYLEDSGIVSSEMTSRYRSEPVTLDNDFIVTANDPDDPDQNGLRTDTFIVPWGERSDWSQLTIRSNDVRPFSITEIEWRGQAQRRGAR